VSFSDSLPPRPSCPVCTSTDGVDRAGPHRWVCTGCWTLFTGGQGEWEQARRLRETYQALRAEKGDE
jgi:ribosomal protein L37AE/L43A